MAQVEADKENIITTPCDNITARTVFSAVRDVFGTSVKKSNKRLQGKVKKVFLNLKKKENKLTDTCPTFDEEWEHIRANFSTIVSSIGNGSWNVLTNDCFSLSCFRRNKIRCDGRIVLTEIKFINNRLKKRLEAEVKYDDRTVNSELMANIDQQLDGPAMDKVKGILHLVHESPVCKGFLANNIDLKVYAEQQYKKHVITSTENPETEKADDRIFSSKCEVFTNFAGVICSKCSHAKKIIDQKIKRHELETTFHPHKNHRYMSREQLVEKVRREQIQKEVEKRKRQRIEAEMVEMEEEDHMDLEKMMQSVDKKDIPEDIQLFWDQQIDILKTKSSNRYRWHPK